MRECAGAQSASERRWRSPTRLCLSKQQRTLQRQPARHQWHRTSRRCRHEPRTERAGDLRGSVQYRHQPPAPRLTAAQHHGCGAGCEQMSQHHRGAQAVCSVVVSGHAGRRRMVSERDVEGDLDADQHGEQRGNRPAPPAQSDASGDTEAQQAERGCRRRERSTGRDVARQRQAHRRGSDRRAARQPQHPRRRRDGDLVMRALDTSIAGHGHRLTCPAHLPPRPGQVVGRSFFASLLTMVS